jgi:hypothetical protein
VKKILASAVGGAAALTVIFGSGPAVADNEWKGRTYEQVQGYTNGRAVIASRTGSYLPTEQCIVTGNRRATYGTGQTKILVDLNCNDSYAGVSGHPGNSVVTEEGKRAQKVLGFIKAWNKGSTGGCTKDASSTKWCLTMCEKYGGCSEETLQALAGDA